MSVSLTWGTAPEERALVFPCDAHASRLARERGKDFDAAYFRGVTIEAAPERIFLWLCQLRVAPYSYDWLDNLGRRSPRRIIPGLNRLAVGQKIMFCFDLIDFAPQRHITFQTDAVGARAFGDVLGSYLIIPQTPRRSRLLVKLHVRDRRGLVGVVSRRLLPWLDLFMMRRQLLNFKELSESTSE